MQRNIGFVFPHYEIPPDAAAIKDLAQGAEALGYDYVLAYDHVLGANPDRPNWRGPYNYTHAFHELFVLFGYLAAVTERLSLVSGILIAPQRQTALLAKQAAQVDVLSGGRLRLGIGIGWNSVEYDALGEEFRKRGKRIEEQVALLRALWTQELVTFEGTFDRVDDAGLNPLPVQQPIPIWFGGGADVVLRRMARLGDGWMPNTMPVARARASVDRLLYYLAEEGRTLAEFGIDIRVNLKDHNAPSRAEYIREWRTLGATHICANTLHAGYTTVQEHLRALQEFIQDVE